MAVSIEVTGDGARQFAELVRDLGNRTKVNTAAARALNHTGKVVRTRVYRTLAKQTGLKVATTNKAMKPINATPSRLEYRIHGRGGDISLRHFKARETRKGVSAAPMNQRKVFPTTFIKGGFFPNRKTLGMNGQVFKPLPGSKQWGRPFEKQRSGVRIPEQMVAGETARAFRETVAQRLPARIAHEIQRLSKGRLTRGRR